MSMSRDAQLAQADIILNRTNVALARSQRLIQSWLTAPTTGPTSETSTPGDVNDDDEDFVGLDELGGLGSTRKADDEGLPDGTFRRKKLASNEKLLEQLLGKKAAQERLKKVRGAISTAVGMGAHAATKTMPERGKVEVQSEDSEDEGGRAAAFKSKRPVRAGGGQRVGVEPADVGESAVAREGWAGTDAGQAAQTDEAEAEAEQRPTKRKAGSYLDEMLSQKANKKKKNKKKKQNMAEQDSSAPAQ